MRQATVVNNLLRYMEPDDFALLAPHLERVPLKARQVLIHAQDPITHTYFPESGLLSFNVVSGDGKEMIGAGLVGHEGFTSVAFDPGGDTAPMQVMAQCKGYAYRIEARRFAEVMDQSVQLRTLVRMFYRYMMVQVCHTALSHGAYSCTARLARWLLMCQDRIGNELPLVHDALAAMLSVRRAGVTMSMHILEGEGAIRATRALIMIRSRAKLLELAKGSYGAAEAEYERVIGPLSPTAALEHRVIVADNPRIVLPDSPR